MDEEDIRTIWCGNLSENVSEEILYELFLQAGPLQRVRIPKARDGKQRAFGFVTYKHECSVPYAMALFEGTELFNREINLQSRNPGRLKLDSLKTSLGRDGTHNRSQSLPTRFSGSCRNSPSDINFETLLVLGQNLMKSASNAANHANMYSSQSGAGQYLGGINHLNEELSNRSLQGNWSNRNHPYLNNNYNNNHHNKRRDRHHHRR